MFYAATCRRRAPNSPCRRCVWRRFRCATPSRAAAGRWRASSAATSARSSRTTSAGSSTPSPNSTRSSANRYGLVGLLFGFLSTRKTKEKHERDTPWVDRVPRLATRLLYLLSVATAGGAREKKTNGHASRQYLAALERAAAMEQYWSGRSRSHLERFVFHLFCAAVAPFSLFFFQHVTRSMSRGTPLLSIDRNGFLEMQPEAILNIHQG